MAVDSSSSLSSTSSKVDMGGPGKLEVAAWLASPSFGVVEGTEAKVTLSIRNFTKKKVCSILIPKRQPQQRNSPCHYRHKGSNLSCFEQSRQHYGMEAGIILKKLQKRCILQTTAALNLVFLRM
jgi:hypothetical protein